MSYADGTALIDVAGQGRGDSDGLQVSVAVEFPAMVASVSASEPILHPHGDRTIRRAACALAKKISAGGTYAVSSRTASGLEAQRTAPGPGS